MRETRFSTSNHPRLLFSSNNIWNVNVCDDLLAITSEYIKAACYKSENDNNDDDNNKFWPNNEVQEQLPSQVRTRAVVRLRMRELMLNLHIDTPHSLFAVPHQMHSASAHSFLH